MKFCLSRCEVLIRPEPKQDYKGENMPILSECGSLSINLFSLITKMIILLRLTQRHILKVGNKVGKIYFIKNKELEI